MNRIEGLLSQISDLENGNKTSQLKVSALKQRTSTLESDLERGKKTLGDRQEEVSQLKERIGILSVERDAEVQNCDRVKEKIKALRERENERGEKLDGDKRAVSTLKLGLAQNLLDWNASLRSSLVTTRRMLKSKGLLPHSDGCDDSVDEREEKEEEEDLEKSAEDLTAEVAKLLARIADAEEKKAQTDSEKEKLRANLEETLKEFEKLDSFTRDIQTRYEAIHEWYCGFEQCSESIKCLKCGSFVDVAATIDKKVEEEKKNQAEISLAESSISAPE